MQELSVLVSSTCYDLEELRSQLKQFIENMGYNAILNEYANILYDPRTHTHTSCLDAVENCDVLILVIGSRFGGTATAEALNKINFEKLRQASKSTDILNNPDVLSITYLEVLKAIECSIPVYTFVKGNVYHDHSLYEKNKKEKNTDFAEQIVYPSIEKKGTAKYCFEFINFIRHRLNDNAIFQFDTGDDIVDTLKKQWSAYFKKLLKEQHSPEKEYNRLNERKRYLFEDINSHERDSALVHLVNGGKVKGLWTDNNGKQKQIGEYLKKAHTIKIKVTRGDDLFEILQPDGSISKVRNDILLDAIKNKDRAELDDLTVQLLIMTPCYKSKHLQNRWETKKGTYTEDDFFSSAYRVAHAIEKLKKEFLINIDYRFYSDLDAKWRYYICNLPGSEPDCLFLSAYTGMTDGDNLDAYQVFCDGDSRSQNLYAYMDQYFNEIWGRSLTLEKLENNIFIYEGICEENKCTPKERARCRKMCLGQTSEYPCYIVEIAGKDSLAAVIHFIKEKAAAHENIELIPTIGLTGTEYSLKGGNSEFLVLYKNSIRSLRTFVTLDEELKKYIHFGEVYYLSNFELWNRLNAKYINRLADIFHIALPCVTCHLYLHLLRVPLYWSKKAKGIITGERHYHGDKIKANQHPQAIQCYEKIFQSADQSITFLQPVIDITNNGDIEVLLNQASICYDAKDVGCVLKGNTNGFTFDDDQSDTVQHMQRYLDEFVEPIGLYLIQQLSQKKETSLNLSPQELRDLDNKIELLLDQAQKHTNTEDENI